MALDKWGSDGGNGQTGRKLVMDYYGPRIAGSGAIYARMLTSTGWGPLMHAMP